MRPFVHEAGAGPAIVLLHGWTMDGTIFDDLARRLAGRFRCIAPDLPGHGRSRHLAPDIDNAADALETVLSGQGPSRAIVVGWSLGAAVAWRFIERFGQSRLAGLVTVDISPRLLNDDGWDLGLIGQDPASTAANTERFRADWHDSAPAIAAGMFADRAGPPALPFEAAVARIRANDPAAMVAMWEALVAADTRHVIPRIGVPMLVAHGLASRVYPRATAAWLAATAPRAERHGFARSGHSPHLEEPEAFAETIAAFATAATARA